MTCTDKASYGSLSPLSRINICHVTPPLLKDLCILLINTYPDASMCAHISDWHTDTTHGTENILEHTFNWHVTWHWWVCRNTYSRMIHWHDTWHRLVYWNTHSTDRMHGTDDCVETHFQEWYTDTTHGTGKCVETHIQLTRHISQISVLKHTFKTEGIRGLYSGCGMTVARAAPSNAVCLCVCAYVHIYTYTYIYIYMYMYMYIHVHVYMCTYL